MLDFKSRADSDRDRDTVSKTIVKDGNHNDVLYVHKQVPVPFRNRDFLSRRVWKQMGDGSFMIATMPITSNDHPADVNQVVRARMPLAMRIVETGDHECTVEYVIQLDFSGVAPAKLTNLYVYATTVSLRACH